MLVLRRIIAALLGTIFVVVTSATAFVFRVNSTLLIDDFYVSQLRNADLFNYAYGEALPLYIDQIAAQEKAGRSSALGRAKPHVLAAMRESSPPEWLQLQSEAAIRQVFTYSGGGIDSFSVTIEAGSRVQATGEAIKQAAANPEVLDLIFEARVRLSERGDPLKTELRALLRKGDTASFVLDQILTPVVRQSLGANYRAPYGQAVTPTDVHAVLQSPSVQPWVQV